MFDLFKKIINSLRSEDSTSDKFDKFCQSIEKKKFISLSFDEVEGSSFVKEMIEQWEKQEENPFPENFSFNRFNFCVHPLLNENNKFITYEMRFFFEVNVDGFSVHYYVKFNVSTENYTKNKYSSIADKAYEDLMKIYLTGYGKDRPKQKEFLEEFKKRLS